MMNGTLFSQFSRINDNLYLSAAGAVSPDKVRRSGIQLIVNCAIEVSSLKLREVETVKLNVDDLPNSRIGLYFDRCADKIKAVRDRGGKILVHCMAGVSRSSTICIAYLMKHHHMTLHEAYQHVKSCRQIIRPNPGFFRQLIDYEQRLYGKTTVTMIPSSYGAIPDVYKNESLDASLLAMARWR